MEAAGTLLYVSCCSYCWISITSCKNTRILPFIFFFLTYFHFLSPFVADFINAFSRFACKNISRIRRQITAVERNFSLPVPVYSIFRSSAPNSIRRVFCIISYFTRYFCQGNALALLCTFYASEHKGSFFPPRAQIKNYSIS